MTAHQKYARRGLMNALLLILPGALASGFLFVLPSPVLAHQGAWTDSVDWSDNNSSVYAIHLMLLPGDSNPYHSSILWFRGEIPGILHGGEWGWKAGNESCTEYPDTSFVDLEVENPGIDVFCAGHAGLADGQLFLPGGTDSVSGIYGDNESRLFTPGTGTSAGDWEDTGEMVEYRWYPTATTLRDGRVFIAGGNRHRHHRIFGGQRDGALPTTSLGDSLHRFAPIEGGAWDPPVYPDPAASGRPDIREEHTFVEMKGLSGFDGQILFGGKNSTEALNDVWELTRADNPTGSDYTYQWDELTISTGSISERYDHSAIALPSSPSVVVFGGREYDGTPLNDIRQLSKPGGGGYEWTALTPSGGPSARFGHTAFYNSMTLDVQGRVERMIVFGGTAHPDSAPTDTSIWELRFDSPTSVSWRELVQVDLGSPRPAPRYWHTLVPDPRDRSHEGDEGRVAYLFGGALDESTYSDSLWGLWLFPDSTVGWELLDYSGDTEAPAARARHTAQFDTDQYTGRLYVYGGDPESGDGDSHVYVIDPWSTSPEWEQWFDVGFNLSGHTMVLDKKMTLARIPEVLEYTSPGNYDWDAYAQANLHWSHTYPLNFLVPGTAVASGGGRIVTVGQDPKAYWLDVPAQGQSPSQGWQIFPDSAIGFNPLTGVQYRPGKVMIAGGTSGGPVTGLTKIFDTSDIQNENWESSESMVPRTFHNLVLLPTGEVLVVGGQSWPYTTAKDSILSPQLWDPTDGTYGSWSDTLATQPLARGYHSTALLLPDGRVLSAGGEYQPDRHWAHLYCPPYLFDGESDNLADRPVIDASADSITWGVDFTIRTDDADDIESASLLRPGATTHAFDQNQRYVPLDITARLTDPDRLIVTSPTSPDSAPPGYYMLFLVGSADSEVVPSVAEWVRVGDAPWVDGGDGEEPATLTDVTVELISRTSFYLTWTATADDDTLSVTGPGEEFEIRYSQNPIHNQSTWNTASIGPYVGNPGAVGTEHDTTLAGLQSCTTYYIANRLRDDGDNHSAIHDTVSAKTLCGGGGIDPGSAGGRPAAATSAEHGHRHGSSLGTDDSRGGVVTADASPQTTSIMPARIMVETHKNSSGDWDVTVRKELLDSSEMQQGVFVQIDDGASGWRTRAHFEPGAKEDRLGVLTPEDGKRIVFVGSYDVLKVAQTLVAEGLSHQLDTAEHSTGGDLKDDFAASDGGVVLADGDVLSLRYDGDGEGSSLPSEWYVLLVRGDESAVSGTQTQDGELRDLPAEFALYQNHPNPTRGATTIRFDLPVSVPVHLDVYNVLGRRVRTLVDAKMPAGRHAVNWDQADDHGRRVASGVYLLRMSAGTFQSDRKLVIIP